MVSLFLKIRNIIVGTYRNIIGYSTDETERRRLICSMCSHKFKFMNQEICGECGCVIDSKITIPEEKCLMNKW